MAEGNANFAKGMIVIALLIAAGVLAYGNIKKAQPSSAINNGHSDDFNPQEHQAERRQMARELNLTPEQQKKIEELRANAEQSTDPRSRFRAMGMGFRDVLTTEQRTKIQEMRQAQRAQRDAKTKTVLGEEQFKKYQELQRARWGGRGGRGGRGGPGGRGGRGGAEILGGGHDHGPNSGGRS